MLGIAVFHMIPHALVALPSRKIDEVMLGVMLGLVTTFLMLRFFHFHQHGPTDFGSHGDETQSDDPVTSTHICDSETHATESHSHHHHDCESGGSATRWVGVLFGLGLHTLMDGVAMASGVAADLNHGHALFLPGIGIFMAVLLHKPLDAVSVTSLMHATTTKRQRLLVNAGFALICPIGAFGFMYGASLSSAFSSNLAGWALAFSAGVFLCLALSDLLPEMEFHSHSRIPLSVALLAGIAAAWAIGLAEGEHAHDHSAPAHHEGHDHSVSDDSGDAHAGHNH